MSLLHGKPWATLTEIARKTAARKPPITVEGRLKRLVFNIGIYLAHLRRSSLAENMRRGLDLVRRTEDEEAELIPAEAGVERGPDA